MWSFDSKHVVILVAIMANSRMLRVLSKGRALCVVLSQDKSSKTDGRSNNEANA